MTSTAQRGCVVLLVAAALAVAVLLSRAGPAAEPGAAPEAVVLRN